MSTAYLRMSRYYSHADYVVHSTTHGMHDIPYPYLTHHTTMKNGFTAFSSELHDELCHASRKPALTRNNNGEAGVALVLCGLANQSYARSAD